MSSPLFNAFGNQMPINNEMTGVINRFQQFKRTFNQDPQQTVMAMVNSGKISQQQLNKFQQMANALSGILK